MSSLILEDVYVQFPIFGSQPSIRKALFNRSIGGMIGTEDRRRNLVVVKALEAISFDLRHGDRLGLIGHNGAGKSTLLKVMAGIYEPVSGQVLASGRITPLLEVLPGIDGEDTGYDNILSSGLMLGMSQKDVMARIADIEEFTELGAYLALPVRTYSSGMLTRLGFALATAIEPDILLIDEGIGAGDQRFAQRAAQRLDTLVGRSRILVLSSHSDALIRKFCNKVALLQEGRIIAIGDADEVIDQYHSNAASAVEGQSSEAFELRSTSQNGMAEEELAAAQERKAAIRLAAQTTEEAEMAAFEYMLNSARDNLVSVYYDRASKLSRQKNYDEALSCLSEALEIDQNSILAHLTIGQIRMAMGNPVQAIESFRRALEIDPSALNVKDALGTAYYAEARVQAGKENSVAAFAMLDECLKLTPKMAHAHLTYGSLYEKAGSTEKALACYERALEIDPSNQWVRDTIETMETASTVAVETK